MGGLRRLVRQEPLPGPASYIVPHRPVPESDAGTGAGGFPAYWKIFRRHQVMIICLGVAGAIAGFMIAKASAAVYQARLSLEVSNFNDNFLNMRDTSPTAMAGGNDYDTRTHAMLLQTPSLLQRTTRKLASAPPPGSRRMTAPEIAARIRDVRVHDSDRTRIIEMTCDATDPQVAADFLNTLASEYIDQTLEARWSSFSHTAEWLTRELNGLKKRLEQSESQLQAYAAQSGLMFAGKDNVAEEKLRQIQEELSSAQADVASRRSRYEMAARSSPDSLPEVRDSPTIRDYQARLTELRRQFAQLNSSYTSEHYKVRRAQAEIEELQTAIGTERNQILRRIENEYQGAVRREALLADAYRRQAGLVTYLSGKAVQYEILKREVETNRRLYETMLSKVREAGISSALRTSNVRVANPAEPPATPYKPRPLHASAIGLIVGILAGWVVLFFRDRSDPKIREPGELGELLQIPELGAIISAGTDPALARDTEGYRLLGRIAPVLLRGKDRETSTALACLHRKKSLLAESFRTTLTSLLMSDIDCRVLVFASASTGDGKTMVVSNLGLTLAAMKERVLIVDADVRGPSLHRIFRRSNSPGLIDLLIDERPLDELNGDMGWVPTDVPRLDLLPAGSGPMDVDLLYSPRLRQIIEKAREEYEMVLIDTPAMLHLSDARILGSVADGVVLVARANHTSRDAAWVIRQRFAQDGIPVLGTVLNDWDPKTTAYGYYRPRVLYDRYGRSNVS